jgi:hypothetical protein
LAGLDEADVLVLDHHLDLDRAVERHNREQGLACGHDLPGGTGRREAEQDRA